MRTLLILLLSLGVARADWFGDGNINIFTSDNSLTNTMNILSNNITFTVWVKIRNTGTGLEQKNVFISKGRLDFTATCPYLLRISGSKLQFNYTDGSGGLHTYQTSSTIIWTNVLRFVALTYTYTNAASMQMYIDGLPVTGSWTAGNGNSNCRPNAEQFSLSGPTAQASGGGFIMGEEGPVALWKTNLTSTQIKMLYDSKVHGLPYMIEPKECVMYMNWDQSRFGVGMDAGSRNADRSQFRQHMPATSGSIENRGNRIFSFIPNE